MKVLNFCIGLKTQTEQLKLVEKINNALNCELKPYDGDSYEKDDIWNIRILGLQIQLLYLKEYDEYYLSGGESEKFALYIDENLDYANTDISEELLFFLKTMIPDEQWEIPEVIEE